MWFNIVSNQTNFNDIFSENVRQNKSFKNTKKTAQNNITFYSF